jgi:hypothetical protein
VVALRETNRRVAVGSLADHLDVGLRGEDHAEPGAHERLVVDDRHPCSCRCRREGQPTDDHEAPIGTRAGVELTTEQSHPFSHPHEAVADADGRRRRCGAAVGDLDHHVIWAVAHDHRRRYGSAVLQDVGSASWRAAKTSIARWTRRFALP